MLSLINDTTKPDSLQTSHRNDLDSSTGVDACLAKLGTTWSEVESQIADREWLVWSCHVHRPTDWAEWIWDFRSDFETALPSWLNIELLPDSNVMDSLVNKRIPLDSGMCHHHWCKAIDGGLDGYTNTYRCWQRDSTISWVCEQVAIQWITASDLLVVGINRRADQAAVEAAARSMAEYEDWIRQEQERQAQDADAKMQLDSLRRDIKLLGQSGQWLIWTCEVKRISANPPRLHWDFRSGFVQTLPKWFDIDRIPHEDLAITLGRSRVPEDDAICNNNALNAILSNQTGYRQLFRIRLRDGRVSYVEENVTIDQLTSDSWHMVGVCVDATERKSAEDQLVAQNNELIRLHGVIEQEKAALAEANKKLSNLATTDGLTGIKNHRAFREQLDTELRTASRYMTPLSLILLDIDHFKSLNDEFGHPAGDAVLVQVGRILQDTARECDVPARYGGEEFAVILPRTDRTGAIAVAERLRVALESACWQRRPVTARLGVATTGVDCVDADTLIQIADKALYQAKAGGRNRVVGAEATPSLPPQ